MSERLDISQQRRNTRRPFEASPQLPGYDNLQQARAVSEHPTTFESFSPNTAYATYMDMPKTFIHQDEGDKLIAIAEKLSTEWLPDYLDAGGWAAAEAALVCDQLPAVDRMSLMNLAQDSWERALENQGNLKDSREKPWLLEDGKEFRIALNLAFTPLMKSIIAGNATEAIREQTFVDTLAIAQTSAIQLKLAQQSRFPGAAGSYTGLGHECNALLAFLYVNDPNFLPIPSTYRAGTGYEHRAQTHDLTIINQHWGNIWNFYPAEIKARPKLKDKLRYQALIIKGRAHLALPGARYPLQTTEAFAACFDNTATPLEQQIVNHTTSTVRDLLSLYRKGDAVEEYQQLNTQTSFHTKDHVVEKYPELRAGQ